jgi:[protein-PII] uridylyltransferase
MGERAEDTFLVTGNILNEPRRLIQLETELIKALRISCETVEESPDESSMQRNAG